MMTYKYQTHTTTRVSVALTESEAAFVRGMDTDDRKARLTRLPLIDADLADLGIQEALARLEQQKLAARAHAKAARREKILSGRLGENDDAPKFVGRYRSVYAEKRTQMVSLYLDDATYEIVRERATKLMLTESDYARRMLLSLSFTQDEMHIKPSRRVEQIEAAARFAWEAKRSMA